MTTSLGLQAMWMTGERMWMCGAEQCPSLPLRQRGGQHPWHPLAVLVLEGGQEQLDWELDLH